MKVAIVSQPWEGLIQPVSNAMEIQTFEIARRLAKSCEVLVYAKRWRGGPAVQLEDGVQYRRFLTLPEPRLVAPVERFLFPDTKRPYFASPLYYLSYVFQVARDLSKQKCDVIHIHSFPQIASLIKRFNPQSKVLVYMHCQWLAELDRATVLSHLRRIDGITGCSEFITGNVRRRFPELAHRCWTIFNGVDISAFQTGDRIPRDPARPPRILFVGRMSPEKGIHLLLDAFRLLAPRCPKAELHLVGADAIPSSRMIVEISDDPHTRSLQSIDSNHYRERLYNALPEDIRRRVHFRGVIPNSGLPRVYREADVFVFPVEWHEPFGVPVSEAMASELPVVATRSGGIVEAVDHGRTGFLVERGDSRALAEALTTLLINPDLGREMGYNGRQRVIERCSWERVIKSLLDLYESLTHPVGSKTETAVTRVR